MSLCGPKMDLLTFYSPFTLFIHHTHTHTVFLLKYKFGSLEYFRTGRECTSGLGFRILSMKIMYYHNSKETWNLFYTILII